MTKLFSSPTDLFLPVNSLSSIRRGKIREVSAPFVTSHRDVSYKFRSTLLE